MKTIAASDGGYNKVMEKKREMEKREVEERGTGKVVPMADALDELLKESGGEGSKC